MEEKKGLLDKIKEKLPGGHKKPEDAAAAASAVHVPAPHTEDVSSSDGSMEKTSLLDKIKDKRPGYHKSSGEEDDKDAAGEHKTTPALIAAHVVPLGHLQRRLLDAGRILVTGGWLVLTYTISNRAANAAHGLIGLALLLLGMFLIMMALVDNQFPGVARAAAAVADAVLYYFFAPAN